jgi:hypothetical protein
MAGITRNRARFPMFMIGASSRSDSTTGVPQRDLHPSLHNCIRHVLASMPHERAQEQIPHLGWTYHERSRIRCRPNFSVTSAGDMATSKQLSNKPVRTPNGKKAPKSTLTSGQVLFIRKDKEQAFFHLPIAQYTVQLLFCLVDSLSVLAVDNEH